MRSIIRGSYLLGVLVALIGGIGCDSGRSKVVASDAKTSEATIASGVPSGVSSAAPVPRSPSDQDSLPSLPAGDALRGKELAAQFECNRCHAGTGHQPMVRTKHCVTCHDDISKGRFPAPASELSRWQKTVDPYTVVPSLTAMGKRFSADWVARFLLDPVDLRPHLEPSMPRLKLTQQQASDLAAYLVQGETAAAHGDGADGGDPAKGRELMEAKSCASCHTFSGVPTFTAKPNVSATDEQQKRAARLAPDLRFTRLRFRRGLMVDWLKNPAAIKPDTLMPTHNLTGAEARDVAAYLYEAELEPAPPRQLPKRLPKLDRKVGFDEVMDKVLGVTCRHCHSDPDVARGDGGPGNTGGFGFAPRKLDLASYRGVNAGLLDENHERQSAFAPTSDGTPRLVAALLARQQEEVGQINPEVRGMPLGLPALTPEQIQLIESWVAQGRPR